VAKNFRRVEVDIDPYTVGEQLKLGGLLRGLRPDLVHFTAANAPVWYGGRRVVTVHDLTLLDYDTSRGSGLGRALRRMKRPVFKWVVRESIARAVAVMTPTEFVKGELEARFGVAGEKVSVTLLAADKNLAEPEPIERFGGAGEFVLFVGNVYPYKNAGLILEAMKRLEGRPNLKLVVTAAPGFWREQLQERARELGMADRLVLTGFVTDGELVGLYRSAKLYVYPSLNEGFGLQILESMVQGLPVLAARASCLPEIGGEAAEYFDPHDAGDLAEKMGQLLDDAGARARLREAGLERAKQFSWQHTAEQTLGVYKRALE
jgi:glycosyltransferase involved in cell wall biosynthesis